MGLDTREEASKKCNFLEEAGQLPERDEILILPGGSMLIDLEGPMEEEEMGKPIGSPILCG